MASISGKARIFVLALAIMLGSALAQEDGTNTDDRLRTLEQELEKQRAEIERLKEEQEKAKLEADQGGGQGGGIEAGYDEGFYVRSSDKKFAINFTGRVQADLRLLESDHPTDSSFFLRRAYLALSGHLWQYHKFKVEVDFGKGAAKLQDGYVELAYLKELTLRVGQFKEPFGMEELTSDVYVNFVERSIHTTATYPSRDIGAMLYGEALDGIINYQVGVFNGSGDNTNDFNDDKDVAVRVYSDPFKKNENMWINGIHFGAAFTWGDQREQNLGAKVFETCVGTDYFAFTDDVVHRDQKLRWEAELAWLVGPASIRGEWMMTFLEDLEMGDLKKDLDIEGYYATATFLVTGENSSMKRVKPDKPFDPISGELGFGAFELAARIAQVHTDREFIQQGWAEGTDWATELSLGVNWYLNANVVFRVNYVRTWFNDDVVASDHRLEAEDAVLLRLQIEW